MAAAGKTDDPYEEIKTHLSKETAGQIEKLGIPGVILAQEKWRVYPAEERAAHVLGFVGYKDEEHPLVGRYGLERYWEDALVGSAGLYVNFFAEIFSNIGALTSGVEHSDGDIITSIEPTVEQRLEETLAAVAQEYNPRITGGIILDPRDGSIIAMAGNPTFNPNTFNTVSNGAVFQNPSIESVFEFGSIMKPLTMAAGIDSGAVTASTTYNDTGFIMRDDAKVSNYDGRARGVVNMQEVLNQSLNTGAAFVAEKMGADTFSRYMLSLGFGEETGIDLPGEVPGIVSGLKSGSALDLASASFGQGVAMTPIAMARALTSLANGGTMVSPHVADQVRLESGIRRRAWQKDERRIFSPEATDTVTNMLIQVVDTALIQGKLKLERHSIAAKTGTAQIAIRGGGYYTDRYLHSFFGYFPAHEPQFLILLYTVEPQGVDYASQTLAEPFGELARFLISYYDIPPDR
jgi:cell division protein FtsI/penicillin-binding protein 2